MSNQRIANFAYFLLSLVVLVVLGQLISQLWGYFGLSNAAIVGSFGWPWVISLIAVVGLFMVLKRPTANNFTLEVVSELRQVTWPTYQDTTKKTVIVIVTVIILSVILGAFDLVWAKASKFLLNSV
ncbi:MAG: preprotein translocase subunit SecE [Myxococcota bacterium]|jgi:preprotein translocase subunit SecE